MRRSEFLRVAALAAAGWGTLPARVGAAPHRAARELGVWLGGQRSLEEWRRLLERLRTAGVTMILPSTRDLPPDALASVVRLAAEQGIAVHAWHITMWSFEPLQQHPEWYAVNRRGESTAVKPPYVDYYRFLCPTREPVQEWVLERVREIASVPGLASVHLDYIRFPDVILPVALWPKYNLVQDREHPEFDYCYCDVCRDRFRAATGTDPLRLDDPAAHEPWLRFRWNAITHVVERCAAAAHAQGAGITAAVFPTPAIARALVRQDWVRWPMDALMPMIYHGFYNEPVEWVGSATSEGVRSLGGRVPLHAGLYLPDLPPDQLRRAARLALDAGASGLVLFDLGALQDGHWRVLPQLLAG